jgi:hypothetical protein
LDGITSTTTYASSYNYTSTNYNIGLHPNNIEPFVDYIDDLRITKGIARYTENFEPPTKAFPNTKCTNIVGNYDPYWDNVVLLMHFDEDKVYHVSGFGSNNWHLTKELACSLGTIEAYVGNKYGRHNSTNNTCQVYNDSSYTTLYTTWTYAEEPALIDVKGHYVSDEPGNTAISSTIKKFGDRSLFSNAKVGQLMGSTSTDYAFGTGDFTIEAWVYLVSATQDIRIWQPTSGEVIPAEIQSSSRRLSAYYGGAIGAVGTPVPLNTWSHIAYFRRDGVLSAALNGIVQWSGALTYNFTAVNWCTYTNSTANTFYMDELRITKGVARYSGNFTVPSTPFQESTSITTTTKYQELNWSVGQPTMNLAQDLNWVIGPNSYHLPGDLNWSTYPIQSATQELAWATRPLIEKNVDIYYAIAPTIKQELQWDISPTIRQDLNWAIGYQVKKEINWSIRQWNTQDVSWDVE